MALNSFDPVRKNNIINFFKEKFNIDLDKYNDDEIKVIYHEIEQKIEQVTEEELKKNMVLTNELHNKQVELLNIINQFADIGI